MTSELVEPSRMKLKWVKQNQCAPSWKLIENYLRARTIMSQEGVIDLAIIPVERDNCVCPEPDTQIIPVPWGLLLSFNLEMFFNLHCVIRIKLMPESVFSLSSSGRGGLIVITRYWFCHIFQFCDSVSYISVLYYNQQLNNRCRNQIQDVP